MIQIKVDGKILFKGELVDWEERPPSEFQDAIKPGHRPDPWMKAVMVTMSDALILNKDLRINVLSKPDGFEMKVKIT